MIPIPSDRQRTRHSRQGKVLLLMTFLLPVLLGVLGIVIDGGMLKLQSRKAQHAADAAATAVAYEASQGLTPSEETALDYVQNLNGVANAQVKLHSPPISGSHAGQAGYVQVDVTARYRPHFVKIMGVNDNLTVKSTAVAGAEPVSDGAAIVLLDPDPPGLSLAPLPLTVTLPSLTPLLGGLEVLGLGRFNVRGAILVNNAWGGLDENGNQVGEQSFLKYACSCTPLLQLTKVNAHNVCVVGGVDNPANYGRGSMSSPRGPPLQANRRPVPDPFENLPAPTVAADPVNVVTTQYGGVSVLNLWPLQPARVLQPGVYEWIDTLGGRVEFEPGVYIIRGKNPVSGIPLNLTAGVIRARGVMFYITDSAAYSPSLGTPDAQDGTTVAGAPVIQTILPSALIDVGLLNSQFSGLDSPGSPFHGMLLYQRRLDRRPIIIVQQGLLGNSSMSGTLYAKWAHVLLTAHGTLNTRIVSGSLRVLSVLDLTVAPTSLLPPAKDVFLVE